MRLSTSIKKFKSFLENQRRMIDRELESENKILQDFDNMNIIELELEGVYASGLKLIRQEYESFGKFLLEFQKVFSKYFLI